MSSREYNRNAQREFYYKRLAIARRILGDVCVVCRTTENLEFDHVDPESKDFSISSGYKERLDVFLAEVGKCQLLCKVHHNEKTRREDRERRPLRHGTTSMYYSKKWKCRCEPCRLAARIARRSYPSRMRRRSIRA